MNSPTVPHSWQKPKATISTTVIYIQGMMFWVLSTAQFISKAGEGDFFHGGHFTSSLVLCALFFFSFK
jgi:hypothetical protein